jgi:hypothetical protein
MGNFSYTRLTLEFYALKSNTAFLSNKALHLVHRERTVTKGKPDMLIARFQASAAVYVKSSLFWDVTQLFTWYTYPT